MTVPLSGCLTEKQIVQLNDKLNELSFEFGTVLDEALAKIIGADFELCDSSDIPQDTGGEQFMLCIVDGECSYISKADFANSTETLTSVSYDPTSHSITYVDEQGNDTVLELEVSTLEIDPATCTLTYTNQRGEETDIALPQAAAPTFDAAACAFTFTDAKGVTSVIPIPQDAAPTFDAATCTFTFEDAKGIQTQIAIPQPAAPEFDDTTCTITFEDAKGVVTDITIPQAAAPTFDAATCVLTFEDAKGVVTNIQLPQVPLPTFDAANCAFTFQDEKGNDVSIAIPQPLAPAFDAATCTLTFEDAKGVVTDITLPQAPPPTLDAATCTLTFTDAKGVATDVSIPQAAAPVFDAATCTFTFEDAKGVETEIAIPQAPLPLYDEATHTFTFEDAKGNTSEVTLANTPFLTQACVMKDVNDTCEETKFKQVIVTDAETGDYVRTYNRTLDGTAEYVPAGTVVSVDCKPKIKPAWNEVINVGDSTEIGLTTPEPGGYPLSCCVKIQVIGGPVNVTLSPGGVPNGDPDEDYAGIRYEDCAIFELGDCCGCGSEDEISEFRAIAAPGTTAQLAVQWFYKDYN
jgi:hypothetical protein